MSSIILANRNSKISSTFFEKCLNVGLSDCQLTSYAKDTQFQSLFDKACREAQDFVFIVLPDDINSALNLKTAIAQICQSNMIINSQVEDWANNFCLINGFKTSVSNIEKITLTPDNCTCVKNLYTMQPSLMGRYLNTKIFVVPDNIDELELVWSNYFVKQLGVASSSSAFTFKLYGLEWQEIEERLIDIRKTKNIQIYLNTSDSLDSCLTLVFAHNVQKNVIDSVITSVCVKFSNEIYANSKTSLAQQVIDMAILYKRKIAVAESFTGGQIASELVSIAGCSKVFDDGVVTYSNDSKVYRLKVDSKLINQYGAVSNEVAYEMAVGLLNYNNCDIIVSTTGIAGPDGGSSYKPVGLCYIAIGDRNSIHVYKNNFSGNRQLVREKAVNFTLFALYKLLKANKN